MNKCNKCNLFKECNEFYRDSKGKNGLRSQCKSCFLIFKKNQYEQNPNIYKLRVKANYEKDPKSKIEKDRVYSLGRRKIDKQFRLKKTLRSRLGHAIKGNFKAGSAVGDLGCSIEFFKQYLESKFQPGMTWNNWSRTGWHIDHIIPLCKFDLSNEVELKKACHYSNMQPMWREDNLRKSGK